MPDFANLPGFTLRELGPTDIPAFIELGLPTCVFMHGRSGVSDDKMLRHFSAFVHEYAFAKDGEIWVVEAPDHSIAAQLWLHHTQNRFNGLDELWIWDITVREDQRRQGIGRNLLEFAIQRAKENRTQELWLLVSSKNDRAVKIYGSRGLEDAGRLMRLSLTGSANRTETSVELKSAVLRPLRPHDLENLYSLWRAAGLTFRPTGRDREDRLTRHLGQPGGGGWGAFEDGKLVAAGLMANDGRKGWIERVATLPERWGSGLAKAVVAACLQSLRETGALVTGALIESENTPSRRLFESLGFIDAPTLCYYSIRDHPED